jgi:hypothetical protein
MHRHLLATTIALIACCSLSHAATHKMKTSEMKLFKLVSSDASQMRPALKLDPILCQVARKRAADMIARNYFSHVNPDGNGPNQIAKKAGYVLPGNYSSDKDANNIESIASGALSPAKVLELWRSSKFHHDHLFGGTDFHRGQTRLGIGIVRKPGTSTDFYVFISAPPNLSPNPPHWVLKNPKGKIIATTGSKSTIASVRGFRPPPRFGPAAARGSYYITLPKGRR